MSKQMIEKLQNSNNRYMPIFLIILCLFSVVSILYAFLCLWSVPDHAKLFFNPDIDTYVYMARNLVYENGNLFLWHIGSAPYFIPEIAILYVITLLSKSPYVVLLLYFLFQITAFFFITIGVFKASTKSNTGMWLGMICAFSLLLLVIIKKPFFNPYGHKAYLTAIMAPGFHFGAFLLTFLALYLFLKILAKPRWYLSFLLFILLVLTGMSDPLTYIYFSIPLLVVLMIFYFFKDLQLKNYILLSLLIGLSFTISYILYHVLPIRNIQIKPHIAFEFSYVLSLIKTILYFVQKDFLLGGIWIIFMVCAPISVWNSFKNKTLVSTRLIDYVISLQFIAVIVSTPLVILSIGQILPHKIDRLAAFNFYSHPLDAYKKLQYFPYRYMINYFLGPIIFGFPLLCYKHSKELSRSSRYYIYAGLLLAISLTAFVVKPTFEESNFMNFHSKLAVCFDKYARQYALTNGITNNYAIANKLTTFNNVGAHVANVYLPSFSEIHWQNTLQLFKYQNYNFAIFPTNVNPVALYRRFGRPTKILRCEDSFNAQNIIYVYANGAMNKIFVN